jgi:hypothetical protein
VHSGDVVNFIKHEKCEHDGYKIINQDEIIKKISTIIENNAQ